MNTSQSCSLNISREHLFNVVFQCFSWRNTSVIQQLSWSNTTQICCFSISNKRIPLKNQQIQQSWQDKSNIFPLHFPRILHTKKVIKTCFSPSSWGTWTFGLPVNAHKSYNSQEHLSRSLQNINQQFHKHSKVTQNSFDIDPFCEYL